MITKTKSIEEVKPIFKEYLDYISRFFEIKDHESWCKTALKNLKKYQNESGGHIFVLNESLTLLGFAMINRHFRFNEEGYAIAEFYIRPEHQKKGLGRKLAEHVFSEFPGPWEVAVSLKNTSAQAFWEKVIARYSKGRHVIKQGGAFQGYGYLFNNSDLESRIKIKN